MSMLGDGCRTGVMEFTESFSEGGAFSEEVGGAVLCVRVVDVGCWCVRSRWLVGNTQVAGVRVVNGCLRVCGLGVWVYTSVCGEGVVV